MTKRDGIVGIGLVGHGFMGAVHSMAWRALPTAFPLRSKPALRVIAGRDMPRVRKAAERFGWACAEDSWEGLIARDDVDVIDICTPGNTHSEVAIAALRAGKHVICEKPLANSLTEADVMAEEARVAAVAGVRSMVAFNYRRVPAVALAQRLISAGRLGELRHIRAAYLQDWLVDPKAPITWRLEVEKAGSGALGDIASHIVDLTQFLTGERILGVSGLSETFVTKRPWSDDPSGSGLVEVDDAVVFIARLTGGAIGTFEATRMATGRKNAMRIEINGSLGSLAFDFERMNELELYTANDEETAGFRRILVTEPSHPYLEAWWPPGHGLGFEHSFTHQAADFVKAIDEGFDPEPSFADGLQVQGVLTSVQDSAASGSAWTAVPSTKTLDRITQDRHNHTKGA